MGLFNKRKSSKKKGLLLSPDEDIGGNISPVSSYENRKSSKKSQPAAVSSTLALNDSRGQQPNPINSVEASPPKEQAPPVERAPSTRQRSMKQQQKEQRTNLNNLQTEPTMDMVHQLVDDLATSMDTAGHQAARALRMLFALSEHASNCENRIAMVREADGQLVPVLLEFLRRCKRTSSEQYLALLVLNNVSIPSENKRIIAIDCGGVHVLSRLLCEDPSCHLMAIILVNLSFGDVELRKELVSPNSSMQLIDALSYVLRVASRTPEEHDARKPLPIGNENGTFPPRKLLAAAMLEDQRHHQPMNDFGYDNEQNELFDPSKQLFPETARWCLCALKNLTRPSKDPLVAQTMIGTGIVPLILRIITIGSRAGLQSQTGSQTPADSNLLLTNSSSRTQSPSPADPLFPQKTEVSTLSKTHGTDQTSTDPIQGCLNNPSTWDANSIQDAALFTILNMAAIPTARIYLHENDAVQILLLIADYGSAMHVSHTPTPAAQMKQRQFQSLKARMALSYLIGSEGHYGQPRSLGSTPPSTTHAEDTLLQITMSEAHDLVELLANTLHQRVKEGPGGYSAATYTVKGILSAVRCLLTLDKNQKTFATASAAKLNALLLKALAQHAVQRALTIDTQAAEHACFSLYIMSNFGFRSPFLPSSFGESNEKNDTDTATSHLVKVLTSYLSMESITAAGRHAADQLLLRSAYLQFKGSTFELENADGSGPSASDCDFNEDLLCLIKTIIVEKQTPGAKPLDDIFNRPILRTRAAQKGIQHTPWENRSSVAIFPSALHAVQQLSFGSTKVLHVDAIDEIVIANNIAKFANGEQSESYNYCWSWEDDAMKPQKDVSRQRAESPSQLKNLITKVQKQSIHSQRDDGPISIFGFKCGTGFCATDTTNNGSKR